MSAGSVLPSVLTSSASEGTSGSTQTTASDFVRSGTSLQTRWGLRLSESAIWSSGSGLPNAKRGAMGWWSVMSLESSRMMKPPDSQIPGLCPLSYQAAKDLIPPYAIHDCLSAGACRFLRLYIGQHCHARPARSDQAGSGGAFDPRPVGIRARRTPPLPSRTAGLLPPVGGRFGARADRDHRPQPRRTGTDPGVFRESRTPGADRPNPGRPA